MSGIHRSDTVYSVRVSSVFGTLTVATIKDFARKLEAAGDMPDTAQVTVETQDGRPVRLRAAHTVVVAPGGAE